MSELNQNNLESNSPTNVRLEKGKEPDKEHNTEVPPSAGVIDKDAFDSNLRREFSYFFGPVVVIIIIILIIPFSIDSFRHIYKGIQLGLIGWLIYSSIVFVVIIIAQLAYSVYKRHVIEERYFNHSSRFAEITATLKSLDYAAAKYNTIGTIAAQVVLVAVIIFGAVVYNLFESTANTINQALSGSSASHSNDRGWLLIIIVILRTSLLGSLIITFILASFKFVSSSFDQAVRFKKRKHATLFLLQLLENKDTLDNLPLIMKAFKEWNTNVESAYTTNKTTTNKDKNKSKGKRDKISIAPYVNDKSKSNTDDEYLENTITPGKPKTPRARKTASPKQILPQGSNQLNETENL